MSVKWAAVCCAFQITSTLNSGIALSGAWGKESIFVAEQSGVTCYMVLRIHGPRAAGSEANAAGAGR